MIDLPVTHPRRALNAAAARPSLAAGATAVVITGVLSLGLELSAAVVGNGGSAAVILSIAVPVMLMVFWLASALLVSAGARLMGRAPQRPALLAVSGLTFPVLVLYAAISIVQAASFHWGGDALSVGVGLLAFPVVCWFVALNALAVRAVYDLPALSAVAIALIPYAALSGALLLLVIVLSVLHGVGVV
ncbi:MAG: YIP1 family protein [Candidatus Dormibacteraeota bacterium]|nr:YIP1 family protein [Candidatus Dormibacteraeota bacterium]